VVIENCPLFRTLHELLDCEAPSVIRATLSGMTMLSFRVSDDDAAEIQRWSEALGWTARRFSAMLSIGIWSA
jgi:hypothetical protein